MQIFLKIWNSEILKKLNVYYKMKPIFYKCKVNDECYKLVMQDNISQDQIDACLDAIGYRDSKFITEDEFLCKNHNTMDVDILDTTNTYKIATLTTKYLNI